MPEEQMQQTTQENNSPVKTNTRDNFLNELKSGNIWEDQESEGTKESQTQQMSQQTQQPLQQQTSLEDQIAKHLQDSRVEITPELLNDPEALQNAINRSTQGLYTQVLRDMNSHIRSELEKARGEFLQQSQRERATESVMNNLSSQIPEMHDQLLKPVIISIADRALKRGVKETELVGVITSALDEMGTRINRSAPAQTESKMSKGSTLEELMAMVQGD